MWSHRNSKSCIVKIFRLEQHSDSVFLYKNTLKLVNMGEIRVGRCLYNNGKRYDPIYPDFTPIIVLTKSSKYGSLGSYVLKDKRGRIFENIWQANKVYESVPATTQTYSRYDTTIIWQHPSEQHVDITEDSYHLKNAYFAWRDKLMFCSYPVRYPVGYEHRHKCLFALAEDDKGDIDYTPLDYIEARKKIYYSLYINLVKKEKQFKQLQQRLSDGENLLIIEVDGPHEESLEYYKTKYQVSDNFIENNTLLATKENLNIMLNDTEHPFGHGYCLAAALQKIDLI